MLCRRNKIIKYTITDKMFRVKYDLTRRYLSNYDMFSVSYIFANFIVKRTRD